MVRRLTLIAALLLSSAPVYAAPPPVRESVAVCDPNQNQTTTPGSCATINNGALANSVQNVTTTASSFTGSSTANAFTSPLAASSTRNDCTIYSANAFSVAPGPSPAANIAVPIPAGGTFKCSDSSIVMGDQINVASATTSNTYVIWVQ